MAMKINLTEREATTLLLALERMEKFYVVFYKAALNRAKTKVEMALRGEKVSAD
jgi:predicted DNA-binding transcriptional regulator YafY